MFVAQAHSFAQQARLAITLAWVAGYTNVLTLLTCGWGTSHMTGITSNLGRDAAEGKWDVGLFALWVLLAFLVGAAISGFCTELGRRRGWESIYVLPMAVETSLLAVFAVGVELHARGKFETGAGLWWMTAVAAAAMGLQNATITRISSGVVRTTHVTGVLTDLGMEAVQFLWWLRDKARGRLDREAAHALIHSVPTHPTARRLALLASIVGSFGLGAALGTLAYDHLPRLSMFPPVLFLMWIIYQDVSAPIAEIEPSTLVGESGLGLPESLAIYHLRHVASSPTRTHRMPNLLDWSERLPPTARVVILDLAGVEQLDANAALELRALLARFGAQRRRLLIAGISPEKVQSLRRSGAGEFLAPSNTCPDLDLAIAIGLNLLAELAHDSRARTA